MVVTIMKTSFRKLKPKIINYKKYKNCSNDIFRDSLLEELSKVRINNDDCRVNNFLRFAETHYIGWLLVKKSSLEVIMHRL